MMVFLTFTFYNPVANKLLIGFSDTSMQSIDKHLKQLLLIIQIWSNDINKCHRSLR